MPRTGAGVPMKCGSFHLSERKRISIQESLSFLLSLSVPKCVWVFFLLILLTIEIVVEVMGSRVIIRLLCF